jgi:hypothetical protein
MGFMGLTKPQRESLELEVVSERARLLMTRLVRHATAAENSTVQIVLQNKAINIANNIMGLPIYKLEAEDGDYYYPSEYGWHNAEIEVMMRRPDTPDLCEVLADLIQGGVLRAEDVNEVLENENVSFSFSQSRFDDHDVEVEVLSIEDIDKQADKEHPNIRVLLKRMDTALASNDPSGVLHASASVFETLAKDVINIEGVQDQTLASFFDRYRKDSKLPNEILDYILDTYRQRNKEPLAGHGSTKSPTITGEKAIVLAEMTKAFVRIERQLSGMSFRLEGKEKP